MNNIDNVVNFINKTPKSELHLHIEGSLEPELMFKLSKRNKIKIPFKSIDEIKSAYNFTDLKGISILFLFDSLNINSGSKLPSICKCNSDFGVLFIKLITLSIFFIFYLYVPIQISSMQIYSLASLRILLFFKKPSHLGLDFK